MKNIVKSGFTLIELLVVITIIGILATGGISVYTAQIEKARDTTRITDIKVLQGGVEQAYQDNSAYPNATEFLTGAAVGTTTIKDYLEDIPGDSKTGDQCNDGGLGTVVYCGYSYKAQDSDSGITMGAFELSVAFENSANVTKKAVDSSDGGGTAGASTDGSNVTYELGVDKITIDTEYDTAPVGTMKGACVYTLDAEAANGEDPIIINGEASNAGVSNCN